jgi:hypothetical protein
MRPTLGRLRPFRGQAELARLTLSNLMRAAQQTYTTQYQINKPRRSSPKSLPYQTNTEDPDGTPYQINPDPKSMLPESHQTKTQNAADGREVQHTPTKQIRARGAELPLRTIPNQITTSGASPKRQAACRFDRATRTPNNKQITRASRHTRWSARTTMHSCEGCPRSRASSSFAPRGGLAGVVTTMLERSGWCLPGRCTLRI